MAYLKEFRNQIQNRDFNKFMQLWEEYCASDEVDVEELLATLKLVKESDFVRQFDPFVETALHLWETIKDQESSYAVMRLLIDLETTNSPKLAEITHDLLKNRYGTDPKFNERLKLVGLRGKDSFQGALSHYDLLHHMGKGKFVYHQGGWGTGEIMDLSTVREQATIEFENVAGLKHITFTNALKTLTPLRDDHFLAKRFANADVFEKEARQDPVKVIKTLLKDLGPKTAAEIKDELCELVIPEADWVKWWQNARAKIKKDTMIESPETIKDNFVLRKEEVTHEDKFLTHLQGKKNISETLLHCYNFARDYAIKLRKREVKEEMQKTLQTLLARPDITKAQELQVLIFQDTLLGESQERTLSKMLPELTQLDSLIENIDILAFKKQFLMVIRQFRSDWADQFIHLLFVVQQGPLRDYIVEEILKSEHKKLLLDKLNELLKTPSIHPDFFVWYFQKITSKEGKNLPYHDKDGKCQFFEAFLVLLSQIENHTGYKDLVKKMYNMIANKRYELVRDIFQGCKLENVKEYLLLASKAHTLSDHDTKILRSLAEVVHPSLGGDRVKKPTYEDVIWATEEGLLNTQEMVKDIGTRQIVDNAREIEAARALGDLRENSEYKYALERRSRLQAEMKTLSDQISKARLITPDDIPAEEVGVGSVVDVKSPSSELTYTILGPWEANPDKQILSFQSKLAQAMVGLRVGDKFQFRDEEFEVVAIRSFFDK